MPNVIVVLGTVMSGIGKGSIAASIASLLSERGYDTNVIKMDGYLNYDAGTLDPYRHGEVFVLDDGTECDMDLGTYERFLSKNLSGDNYLTSGKLFYEIIKKEREGYFKGEDVQFVPHVVNDIIERILTLPGEFIIVEIGGTAGDIENSYFIEAVRQLSKRVPTAFVVVTYVPEPPSIGEQKTKPAQQGLRILLSMGVTPTFIVARSHRPLEYKAKYKLSLYGGVPLENVISVPDLPSIYHVPVVLEKQGLISKILKLFGYEDESKGTRWEGFVKRCESLEEELTIGVIGKYADFPDAYVSIRHALIHAGVAVGRKPKIIWINTRKEVKEEDLSSLEAAVIPGGFGKEGAEGIIKALKILRENEIPTLAICRGMQLLAVEIVRDLVGYSDAHTTEIDPNTRHPVVIEMPGYSRGRLRKGLYPVSIVPGTHLYEVYGSTKTLERHRHRFYVNPEYFDVLRDAGAKLSARSGRILEGIEIGSMIGVQFHPEFLSRPREPSKLFLDLYKRAIFK